MFGRLDGLERLERLDWFVGINRLRRSDFARRLLGLHYFSLARLLIRSIMASILPVRRKQAIVLVLADRFSVDPVPVIGFATLTDVSDPVQVVGKCDNSAVLRVLDLAIFP